MMGVLPRNVCTDRSDVPPANRACVIAATPADRFRAARRLRLRIANKWSQRGIGAVAHEHMHMVRKHGLSENTHVVTLCCIQDRCRNDLDVALGDRVLTPPRPPGDVCVEFERLVPIVSMKHNHSG